MIPGGRPVRVGLHLVALGGAAAVTVLLARQPASGAFSGATQDTGNQVTTATEFCTARAATRWAPRRTP